VEHAGGLLVALELQQPLHQGLARVLLGLALRLGGIHGDEHLGLDVDEGGRHDHEVPRHVQVQLPHQVQVLHVLARDGGDGDVVDVDLVLANEVQQQVQRPLEEREMDARGVVGQRGLREVRGRGRLRARLRAVLGPSRQRAPP
jgi:hypothetical protein